ncbi:ABC transporter substrate-binding protein [Microbacterium sp. zg.Y1090]|uniref:ABC transporter substrate-binding protein n=1 Tax=Microbacterium TaxID=33882 RepID=UPI00214C0A18|nr:MULTISPECIES: ABC transporter substrate-binding protein [unclassified Microbacterium]MCR2814010.1 ABC transporter substrate-binding protein [Microbacterium sp. zg.Y1084]MCR2819284.1 ABC transporter substrate-binding protein [Microbacterium sp. zg.Y1090]MDL5487201.1 ABC transporter substrate-binding protein [Microbacterium sp. zg-Y1211]WIM28266.1 ABC transporter substrate-binding protein [Microbacterium sp. zg-Y1090]
MKTSTRAAAVAAVATLAAVLTACSPSSPAGESTPDAADATTLDSVTVGILAIADLVPIHMGLEAGVFEEHGIDLELEFAQGGAAIVPAVVSGEYDFGYSNVVSLLVAHENSIPIQIVSNGSSSSGVAGADATEVAALADSGIEDALDLQGKRVAINALGNFGEITIRNSIAAAGGDPDAVTFVEIPYPNMPAQLAAGEVDAAWTTEPFRSQILAEGGAIVASPMTDMSDSFDSAYFFTSTALAADDADLVSRFTAAVHESFALAMEDEAATRAALVDFNELDEATAKTIAMPTWHPEINRDGLEALAAAAKTYGVLREDPDYTSFLGE